MKNIFQSLSIATLLGLFVPFISSCSDDEEVFNEWNATYVSLHTGLNTKCGMNEM